ncbi:hypothetical protein GLOTRDRAFT_97314 [Gloeophyllum trabeum ATCC 11539]|uniref:Uncharacterized protein n=1 Tax=Gloeophyllum trabeum (strain ATCC 11539 / FP-39264 / Madison 617) TaxID=670483 RepID=S7PR28_GLOTA|nr:uncharacterized protein GLOTRDRAFT_97314 [Gloeophyllum trabeum ATCC 11539]EPQ49928.1 hypothetical protein GLOTRDRAFT_97314 [Gloeophyllum trabeum ATCC 11539]
MAAPHTVPTANLAEKFLREYRMLFPRLVRDTMKERLEAPWYGPWDTAMRRMIVAANHKHRVNTSPQKEFTRTMTSNDGEVKTRRQYPDNALELSGAALHIGSSFLHVIWRDVIFVLKIKAFPPESREKEGLEFVVKRVFAMQDQVKSYVKSACASNSKITTIIAVSCVGEWGTWVPYHVDQVSGHTQNEDPMWREPNTPISTDTDSIAADPSSDDAFMIRGERRSEGHRSEVHSEMDISDQEGHGSSMSMSSSDGRSSMDVSGGSIEDEEYASSDNGPNTGNEEMSSDMHVDDVERPAMVPQYFALLDGNGEPNDTSFDEMWTFVMERNRATFEDAKEIEKNVPLPTPLAILDSWESDDDEENEAEEEYDENVDN